MTRCAFIIEAASSDPADDRVVFTCAKNNNGDMGHPSAWRRCNGQFEPVSDFDWTEFYTSGDQKKGSDKITEAMMELVFDRGPVDKSEGVKELMKLTGCKQSAAYNALKIEGRFRSNLRKTKDGKLSWEP
jgi:hypothetical protein